MVFNLVCCWACAYLTDTVLTRREGQQFTLLLWDVLITVDIFNILLILWHLDLVEVPLAGIVFGFLGGGGGGRGGVVGGVGSGGVGGTGGASTKEANDVFNEYLCDCRHGAGRLGDRLGDEESSTF